MEPGKETVMLAAETAWRILHAEHAQMRGLLDEIESIVASLDWCRPGPALEQRGEAEGQRRRTRP
jgi:hypothetical protein